MTVPAPGVGRTESTAAARGRALDAAEGATVDGDAADVHWPDPSPLRHWWTEVMDGPLLPRPCRAA